MAYLKRPKASNKLKDVFLPLDFQFGLWKSPSQVPETLLEI